MILDLRASSVLLRLPENIDDLSPDQFYEKYGQPQVEPVERYDGQSPPINVPTHGTVPVYFGEENDVSFLSEPRIFLSDFGKAFLPSMTSRHFSPIPDLTVPPELFSSLESLFLFPLTSGLLLVSSGKY